MILKRRKKPKHLGVKDKKLKPPKEKGRIQKVKLQKNPRTTLRKAPVL